MAVSRAKELGVSECAIPTAGNAGGAMSAYCAKAEMGSFVFMPRDTPEVFRIECEYYGAHVTLVDGLITDCGAIVRRITSYNVCYTKLLRLFTFNFSLFTITMSHYPASVLKLIKNLSRLPGIGEKTAERLAMHSYNFV